MSIFLPGGSVASSIQKLGWVRDLPDHRDFRYSVSPAVLRALPSKVDLPFDFECYDQGRIGSCTANALAAAVEYDRRKSQQLPSFSPSRLFIYYNERDLENTVPLDSGAQIRDGVKVLQKLGVCPESMWPYDDTPAMYENGPFPDASRAGLKPDQEAYNVAEGYVVTSYQRLDQTLSQLRGCLAAGFPFVFGFTVYSGWFDQYPQETTIPLPSSSDSRRGGHAVLCVGYDDATALFKIRNSWGGGVGENGYFYMPYAYLTDSSMSSDFWVINAVKS